jgi:hypothetical protein
MPPHGHLALSDKGLRDASTRMGRSTHAFVLLVDLSLGQHESKGDDQHRGASPEPE